MSDLTKIVEELSALTVIEAANLAKLLEKEWGVSAAAPVAVAAAPAGGESGSAESEKTEFDVILTAVGDKKIEVIKAVRAITGLGLKEAKAAVEEPSSAIKQAVSKSEADDIKGKLESAGATVEVK